MKKNIIYLVMFFGFFVYAQEFKKQNSIVKPTPYNQVVAEATVDHYFFNIETQVIIQQSSDSLHIKGIIIREKKDKNPISLSFFLVNLSQESRKNNFKSTSKKFNDLVKIYLDSNFSEDTGGKIIFDIKKKTWVTDTLYLKKKKGKKGFLLNKKDSISFKKIDAINIALQFWAKRIESYSFNIKK